jgi:hypothetical protein
MTDNKEIVKNVYKLAEVKDIQGFVNAFTPDGTFTDESIQVVYRGQDIARTVEIYAAAFPDIPRALSNIFSWRRSGYSYFRSN